MRKELMSKTYKTHPTWVKINNPKTSKEVVERHDHTDGVCDINNYDKTNPFYWQRRYLGFNCGDDVSYYGYHGGFYARPRRGRLYRQEHEGAMRAGWRKAKHDLLKLDKESVEDYDVKSYQHRHSALWEMY
jgi:hypothetical protein